MLFSTSIVAAALASTAFAKTIPIKVGNSAGDLTFSPNSTAAAVGDVLEFHFYAKNHTVTQGSFATPCEVGTQADAFYSGFVPTTGTTANAKTFQVNVTSTTPMWVFCSQTNHCKQGMAMVVNQAATGAKTLDAYVAAAAKLTTAAEVPAKVQGGVFASSNSSSSTSSSTSTGSGTSTTSTATGTSATSASTSSSAAGNVAVSPLNMAVAGAAAVGAFAFSVAL